MQQIGLMHSEINTSLGTIRELQAKVSSSSVFNEQFLQSDDAVRLYTGLPSLRC